jgi:hypothetical protein
MRDDHPIAVIDKRRGIASRAALAIMIGNFLIRQMSNKPMTPVAPDAPFPLPSTLEYAPSSQRSLWRRLRRVLRICLVITVALVAWKWGWVTWNKTVLLYHQHQCLSYSAPADQVVFDTDPGRVAKMASDPNYVLGGGMANRRRPADWDSLVSSGFPSITRLNRASNNPVLFMHERKSPNGTVRLVVVERTAGLSEPAYFILGFDVDGLAIEPGTITRPPHWLPFAWDIDVLSNPGPHRDIRIYAGQVDPADASHFTIRYESGGQTNIADGTLGDDGEVHLGARPLPVTANGSH